MDSEDKLVERVRRAMVSGHRPLGRIGRFDADLKLGVGDDAALISPTGRMDWVLTCDAFLEGVHFLPNLHPPDSVGYKALARATSDLAAMGSAPRFFLLTLALPASRTGVWLNDFLKGMKRAARTLGIVLIGGDTTKHPYVLASITVVGEIARGEAISRAGARPGDIIYVSGTLGRAQLGLELVLKGFTSRKARYRLTPEQRIARNDLLQPHLYPRIKLELGSWLAQTGVASAMMDLSDGLSTDLPRLCTASGVGARLRAADIPRPDIAKVPFEPAGQLKLDPFAMALHGGEDYELLFTVPPRHLRRLRKAPGFPALAAIGEITPGKSVLIENSDGTSRPLISQGWDPFRHKARKS